ncbi:DUF4956 domain-containing protein [Streptomyces heilongjiangensis]|uniref:DUF4956 domain-containing protein n=1 Tax=Streptomyces heilongjiangensis TaxID=945052 RepID=A0ABW1BF23_9ACTN|nr:DUF4956 domain-containing protein [Streptomyces heilongjiangensis]MDC2946162.1 DUF4956 domain-containing protein [Streptomyces heilongjiangensis]
MDQTLLVVADLAAISVLTFAVYFPRHHRRDLIAAFLGVNVGVLAVAMTLSSSSVGVGLGMGLFGVLSIIRLRSNEIAQHEIAYYFSALALGLLAGLPERVNPLSALLMTLVVATMYVADHPRLYGRHRQRTLRLDAAHTDEDALRAHLEALLGGRVVNLSVQNVDLVNDFTLVDVRYVADGGDGRGAPRPAGARTAGPRAAGFPETGTAVEHEVRA